MIFLDELDDNLDSMMIPCHIECKAESCRDYFLVNHNFKILTLNIRSIQKNFNTFLVGLKRMDVNFDILVLTECWLNDTVTVPQLDGYKVYKSNKNNNQNSGIVVYVREIWDTLVSEPDIDGANCVIIHILKVVKIVAIYRSPSVRNIEGLLHTLEPHVNTLDKLPLVLAGDTNVNILDTTNSQVSEYLCFMAENGLIPAITESTRGRSCLDHIFISSSILSQKPVGIVCQSDITDHYPVMAGIHFNKPKPLRPNRCILKRNVDNITKELLDVDWSFLQVQHTANLNVAAEQFTNIISETVAKYTREVRISRKQYNLKPWITPGLMRCMRHRDRLHLKARLEPDNQITQISYSRYHNFFVDLLRKLRIEYENNLMVQNKNNPKKLWRSINTICNLPIKREEPTALLKKSDALSSRLPLDICNDYFSTIGSQLANNILRETNQTESQLASAVKIQHASVNSFFLVPANHTEVENIIMNLKNEKAPGIDNLTNSLLKNIKDAIIEPLTELFNRSLSEGVFPNIWKIASITPVHKSGPKDCIENYRPISLLVSFSKILEKLVNKRLTGFLENNFILSPRQFGFRRGKSTEDAVSLITSIVSSRLDNNLSCLAVFLDLAKAFDTVSVPILLNKLEKTGIRGMPLDWFKSYLSERRQCVKIDQSMSEQQEIRYGVPQGSILGPTLFTLYINDIHDIQLNNAEIVCYADDTAIVYHGSNWSDVQSQAEKGMAGVSKWLQANLLTLNAKKTEYLCFHKTAASAPITDIKLKIHSLDCQNTSCNCESLNRQTVIKYLGVLLDEKLTFRNHIVALSARVRRVVGIVKLLRDIACSKTLLSVYYALCQSILSYCITCWGSAAKTFLIMAERAQRSVLKVMMKRPFRYPTSKVYEDSGVLSVRQLFIFKIALSVHKSVISSEDYKVLEKKRVFRLPTPPVNTTFAHRFGQFVRVTLYNIVNKHCNLKLKSPHEAKRTIYKWLTTLNYDSTEELIKIKS